MRGFETEEQLEEFVKTDPKSGKILAAIVFEHQFTHDDEPLPLQVRWHELNELAFHITLFLFAYSC